MNTYSDTEAMAGADSGEGDATDDRQPVAPVDHRRLLDLPRHGLEVGPKHVQRHRDRLGEVDDRQAGSESRSPMRENTTNSGIASTMAGNRYTSTMTGAIWRLPKKFSRAAA